MERVVGDQAAPDEGPERVDGFAGKAATDGLVKLSEEQGSAAGEGRKDGVFAGAEGFGACCAGWEQGGDAVGQVEGDAAVAFA